MPDRRLFGAISLPIVFGFLVVFGGALFFLRPHPTPAQLAFRAALVLLGIAGLGVLRWRRRAPPGGGSG